MISITKTLTADEKTALEVTGNTEQAIANRIADRLDRSVASEVSKARHILTSSKTITELQNG